MDILSLSLGCAVGGVIGAFLMVMTLAMCRAAAMADEESEYFERLVK